MTSFLISLLALLALLPLSAAAQQDEPAATTGSIAGRVITVDDIPVTDAEVQLVDLRRSVAVDQQAAFSFAAVPPGSYLLEAVSPEFGKAIARVEVAAGRESEVTLDIDLGIHSEEILITANPLARSQLEIAKPTNVLSGEELIQRQQATLGETLAEEPGITSTYFGPGASRPVIRGLGGDRVRMLQGGLGTGDASSTSPDHAVTIDPLSAERIEVVRGPATLLYGSSAIGGVVNVLDGRIPSTSPGVPLTGTVDLRAGSVADERAGSLELGGELGGGTDGDGKWAWQVDYLRRETDDYEIPAFAESRRLRAMEEEEHGDEEHEDEEHEDEEVRDRLPNSDLTTEGGSAGLSYFFGEDSYVGLSVSGFDSLYGIPGAGHGHEEEEGEHGEGEGEGEEEGEEIRIDMEQRRIDLAGELGRAFGPFRGARFRIGTTDYEHSELEGEGEVGTVFFNDSIEGRLELIQRQRGRLNGSVGLQLRQRELEAVGEEAFIPANDTASWALFTFQELDFGDLRLELGGRYEVQDTEAAGGLPSRSFDGLSASAGLVWEPGSDYGIALSLARSVKAPNAEELYSNGAHFATQAFEVGDPRLDEESSVGVDLSFRKRTGRLTGELTLFANRFDDFIFQSFTGDQEDGLPVALYSQADAEFLGAELSARLGLYEKAGHHVDLQLSGDYVEAELSDNGEKLPRIPPMRFGAGLHYDGDRLHGRVQLRRVEEQDDVAPNELPTDGYTFVNASVGYRLILGERIIDLLLRGTNLTDEEGRSHTSFLKDRVPLPGRDVSLSLRLSF